MTRLLSPDGRSVRTWKDVPDSLDWLEQWLARHGFRAAANGYLSKARLDVERNLRWRRSEHEFETLASQLGCIRRSHSHIRILRALRGAFEKRTVPGLEAKLAILRDQPMGLQDINKNNPTRDIIWEIFVGACFSHVVRDLRFGEPDIRFRFCGVDWAIECKAVHSEQTKQHRKALRRAAVQIEESDADVGMVWLNITSQIDHDSLLRPATSTGVLSWTSPRAAATALARQVEALREQWDQQRFAVRLTRGPGDLELRRIRGAAMFAESVMHVDRMLDDHSHTYFYPCRNVSFHEDEIIGAFRSGLNRAT